MAEEWLVLKLARVLGLAYGDAVQPHASPVKALAEELIQPVPSRVAQLLGSTGNQGCPHADGGNLLIPFCPRQHQLVPIPPEPSCCFSAPHGFIRRCIKGWLPLHHGGHHPSVQCDVLYPCGCKFFAARAAMVGPIAQHRLFIALGVIPPSAPPALPRSPNLTAALTYLTVPKLAPFSLRGAHHHA